MKQLWLKVRSRIPVSRGRYERELKLLKLSVNRTIAEEQAQLETMLYRLYQINFIPDKNGARTISVQMKVSDDLIYSCRSPYHRGRMFYEIAKEITYRLEKEFQGR